MAKKKIDMSKLGAGPAKKVVKKSMPTSSAIAAIHKNKPTRTSLDIPSDIHKRLKIRAVQTGVSMKNLILQYIVEGLDEA